MRKEAKAINKRAHILRCALQGWHQRFGSGAQSRGPQERTENSTKAHRLMHNNAYVDECSHWTRHLVIELRGHWTCLSRFHKSKVWETIASQPPPDPIVPHLKIRFPPELASALLTTYLLPDNRTGLFVCFRRLSLNWKRNLRPFFLSPLYFRVNIHFKLFLFLSLLVSSCSCECLFSASSLRHHKTWYCKYGTMHSRLRRVAV